MHFGQQNRATRKNGHGKKRGVYVLGFACTHPVFSEDVWNVFLWGNVAKKIRKNYINFGFENFVPAAAKKITEFYFGQTIFKKRKNIEVCERERKNVTVAIGKRPVYRGCGGDVNKFYFGEYRCLY